MIPCPNCQNSVEIDEKHLGTLFTCPHCGAVYFVNFDGQAEMADHETESQLEDFKEGSADAENFSNPAHVGVDPLLDGQIDVVLSNQSFEDELAPSFEISHGEGLPISESLSDVSEQDHNQADFSDVLAFGNSDADVSTFKYVVTIEGIDSSKLRHDLAIAMSDTRFGWDPNDLISQITQERLVLTDLSTAKAFVLINRIKYLPLKIFWRQDVLSSS